VRAGRVAFQAPPERPAPLAVVHADAEVALVRVAAGATDRALRAAVDAGVDGIVLEGSGLGHVPGSWMPAVRAAVAAAIPVVRTSRAAAGGTRSSTSGPYDGPGGDTDLRAAGVLDGGERGGLAARIELLCAIGAGLDAEGLRARFQ
jgi:L-asparaginase